MCWSSAFGPAETNVRQALLAAAQASKPSHLHKLLPREPLEDVGLRQLCQAERTADMEVFIDRAIIVDDCIGVPRVDQEVVGEACARGSNQLGAGTGAEADALAEQVQRALEAARLSGPVQLMSGPSAAGQG